MFFFKKVPSGLDDGVNDGDVKSFLYDNNDNDMLDPTWRQERVALVNCPPQPSLLLTSLAVACVCIKYKSTNGKQNYNMTMTMTTMTTMMVIMMMMMAPPALSWEAASPSGKRALFRSERSRQPASLGSPARESDRGIFVVFVRKIIFCSPGRARSFLQRSPQRWSPCLRRRRTRRCSPSPTRWRAPGPTTPGWSPSTLRK